MLFRIVVILIFFLGSTAVAQSVYEPKIICVSECSKPQELDTLLVFPPRVRINTINFMGDISYNWKITADTKDSLSNALVKYFDDSTIIRKNEEKKSRYTVGLKFPEFDSIKRKLIYDSIPVISIKVIKRKADTVMYVPDLFYWLLERQHERYALLINITGHVKDADVYITQEILNLISTIHLSPVTPGVKTVHETNFTCHIIDLDKKKIIYSGSFSKVLPANYTDVLHYFLKQFFDDYLEKK